MIRFKKVDKNLYRGGSPTNKDVQQLVDDFGIKRIVSLDQDTSDKISKKCKQLGVEHITIPLDFSKKTLLKLLKYNIVDLLGSKKTFVHCKAGKDRTGLAVALYKIDKGTSPTKALEEALAFGFGVGLNDKARKLYTDVILSDNGDENDATDTIATSQYDISNEDNYLRDSQHPSFAPFLDSTKTYPNNVVYPEYYRNHDTVNKPVLEDTANDMPIIGIYNNDGPSMGYGPTEQLDGFFDD